MVRLSVLLPIPMSVTGQKQERQLQDSRALHCIWPGYKLGHIQVVINYTQRPDQCTGHTHKRNNLI